MLHILTEDGNKELKHRNFPLGDNIRKHLQATLDNYKGDKTIDGYKRLNNVLSMENGIAYSEMKRLKNYFDNYKGSPKSVEYILNGGEPMRLWVNATLNRATKGVEDFKAAKKAAGIENAYIKPHEKDRQTNPSDPTTPKIQTRNAAKDIQTNSSIKYEKIIRESIDDEHPFYEYLEEYGCSYVLSQFAQDPKGKQKWGVIIDPNMYAKALEEYTRYGELYRFPHDRIHQWMGIIMKNSAILYANTQLAGHTAYCPLDEAEYFLEQWFGDNFVRIEDRLNITFANEKGEEETRDFMDVFDEIGLYDWMSMPDGESCPWTDYGIEPIFGLISKYNQNLSAEETLVLINKIIDVYHSNGDLSCIFVKGGSSALNRITFRQNESKKHVIYITENQLRDIYHKIKNKNV